MGCCGVGSKAAGRIVVVVIGREQEWGVGAQGGKGGAAVGDNEGSIEWRGEPRQGKMVMETLMVPGRGKGRRRTPGDDGVEGRQGGGDGKSDGLIVTPAQVMKVITAVI